MCNCNKNNVIQGSCGCLSEYSGDCIIYDGNELVTSGISVGLTFNKVIEKIDEYFNIFKNEINNFINITNLGNGAKLYKGDNILGQKELRTLSSSTQSLEIIENIDEVNLKILPTTTTLQGIITLATQAEVDAGTDNEKAVTPSTLTTLISNPSSLPNSTETQRGVAEIATQAEVDAGTDNEKFVTPSKLKQFVTTEVSNPTNLPVASETSQGVIEIATQAEVDAGTDDFKAVTPAKMNTFINDSVNLPNATQTQRGVAEIATQAEVDAGTDNEKFVTPLTLSQAVSSGGNTGTGTGALLPINSIIMWSGAIGDIPTGWKLCDGIGGTPNLRGKFVVGYDSNNPDYNTIGNTGGLEEVTLTESQIPPHDHGTNSWGRESQSVNDGNGSIVADNQGTATIGQTGGGQPHENRPPYFTLAYIIYTG